MLGIDVSESTVGRYMIRAQRPQSQGWRTFLRNHAAEIASIDLFVVRTISFKLLYGLVVLSHARRGGTLPSDCRSSHRGLSVERSSGPSDPRPQRGVRTGLYPARSCDGHPRSPERDALTLAERTCRAATWLESARVSGSRGGVRRGAPASSSQNLRLLLQRNPDPYVVE